MGRNATLRPPVFEREVVWRRARRFTGTGAVADTPYDPGIGTAGLARRNEYERAVALVADNGSGTGSRCGSVMAKQAIDRSPHPETTVATIAATHIAKISCV